MAQFSQPDRNRPLPGPQMPRMDPGARGYVMSNEAMIRAQQAPKINDRAFVAEAAARAAFGQAAQDMGGAIGKIAMEQLRSVNEYQIAEAGTAMETAGNDIMAEIAQEPDETKWKSIAEKRIKKLDLAKNLSPYAKRRVEVDQMRWSSGLLGRVTVESAKASFEREIGAKKAVALRLADQGNADGAVEVMRGLHNRGRISDLDFAQSELSLRDKAKKAVEEERMIREKAEMELEAAEVINDPFEWKKKNPNASAERWKGRELGWKKMNDLADERVQEETAGHIDQALNRIYSDELTVESEIDAMDSPAATPKVKAELKKHLASFNKAKADEEKRQNGDFNFVREYVAATQLSFEGMDAEDKAIAFTEVLNRVLTTVPDDGRLGAVKQELFRKFGAKPPDAKVPSESQQFINSSLKAVYDAWGFGRLMDWSDELQKNVANPETERKAQLKFAEAHREMRLWMEQNPQAPLKEIEAKLGQVLNGSVTDDVAAKLGVPVSSTGVIGAPQWQQWARDYHGPAIQGGMPISGLKDGKFTAKATGYFPVDPGHPDYQMEGGRVGAAEWHGKSITQEKLFTLEDFRDGKAPYVSVAMDNSTANPLAYGTLLRSPQFPGVVFRVMDTGSAFNGRTKVYGAAKGTGRIDIARRTKAQTKEKAVNQHITFEVISNDASWDEDIQQPPFSH